MGCKVKPKLCVCWEQSIVYPPSRTTRFLESLTLLEEEEFSLRWNPQKSEAGNHRSRTEFQEELSSKRNSRLPPAYRWQSGAVEVESESR